MEFYREPTPEWTLGMEVHHIVAVADGGSNCTHDAMLLCWKCHRRQGGKGGVPQGADSQQIRLV
jgi:5-methylcytosine-specific restriction endonuclease McrA